MDRFTSLTVFGQVVEAGGFTAAARRLGMSVTMVSSHVQALEERLGARLLNRTTRKVSLTGIGQAYYERTRHVVSELAEADDIASSSNAKPVGSLKLFVNAYMIRFLAPVLAEYLDAHPAVTVDLTAGERTVDMVEEGFDLVIRTVPLPDSSLVVRRLTPWRHILCCAPRYLERHPAPATPADLAHHNCLQYAHYPFGHAWHFEGPDGAGVSVPVSGNLATNSGELLRYHAMRGDGIALGASFIISDDVASGALVRLLPGYRPVEFAVNALYPHRRYQSAKLRTFLDLLAERFAEHRRWTD